MHHGAFYAYGNGELLLRRLRSTLHMHLLCGGLAGCCSAAARRPAASFCCRCCALSCCAAGVLQYLPLERAEGQRLGGFSRRSRGSRACCCWLRAAAVGGLLWLLLVLCCRWRRRTRSTRRPCRGITRHLGQRRGRAATCSGRLAKAAACACPRACGRRRHARLLPPNRVHPPKHIALLQHCHWLDGRPRLGLRCRLGSRSRRRPCRPLLAAPAAHGLTAARLLGFCAARGRARIRDPCSSCSGRRSSRLGALLPTSPMLLQLLRGRRSRRMLLRCGPGPRRRIGCWPILLLRARPLRGIGVLLLGGALVRRVLAVACSIGAASRFASVGSPAAYAMV